MKKYKVNKGFITQKIGNKTAIFAGEKSILYTLNDTAAFIFQGLKLGWSKDKVKERLVEKYKIGKKEAEADISEFVQTLLSKKIIS